MNFRDPIVKPVAITELRPTQMTVGLREVAQKSHQWRDLPTDEAPAFLGRHMIPTILGPKDRHYVVDHHHLARALLDQGVENVLVSVVADLRAVKKASFWTVLDNRSWCHPYDHEGWRRDFDAIPKTIAALRDDPYRSLAGELRRAGGFAKDTTPFSEFLWADFLRGRVKIERVQNDFDGALAKALILAKRKDANYLPGWCGPDPIG